MADSELHPDVCVREVLGDCPFLIGRLDLQEASSYLVFGEIALLMRDAKLSHSEMNRVFAYLKKMATADLETQNLLVVGVLEILTDTPASIQRARAGLGTGPARMLFERVLKGYSFPSPRK